MLKLKNLLNEALPTREIDPKQFPNPVTGTMKKMFLTKGEQDGDPTDDIVKTQKASIPAVKLKASQDAIYLGKSLGMAVGGVKGGDLDAVISWISNSENQYSNHMDVGNIILIGHSRGGGIVTIKASEDDRIAKVITLAGASDYKSRFPTGDELAFWRKEGVAYIENARTKQKMPHFIQFYDDFMANEARLTISLAAKQINIPHLIIHGTTDETVPFQEAEAIHSWNSGSELFAIEDANHVFGGSHPWESDSLPKDLSIAINEMLAFIKD